MIFSSWDESLVQQNLRLSELASCPTAIPEAQSVEHMTLADCLNLNCLHCPISVQKLSLPFLSWSQSPITNWPASDMTNRTLTNTDTWIRPLVFIRFFMPEYDDEKRHRRVHDEDRLRRQPSGSESNLDNTLTMTYVQGEYKPLEKERIH